jgi:hypothetical protein
MGRSAIQQLDALCCGRNEVLLAFGPVCVRSTRLDAADVRQRRGMAIGGRLDPEGDLRELGPLRTKASKRHVMANYFDSGRLASAMMPVDQHLPNGRPGGGET